MIGWGESDAGIETGSYHAALDIAGNENHNLLRYGSCCYLKRSSSHTCLTFNREISARRNHCCSAYR
jgi:hypothetical protein